MCIHINRQALFSYRDSLYVPLYKSFFFWRCCTSCVQCVDVCLHNDSWFSCGGGLRSWEKHDAIAQRCVPLGGPDAPVVLRLGRPASHACFSSAVLFTSSFFRLKERGEEQRESSRPTPEEPGLNSAPETL